MLTSPLSTTTAAAAATTFAFANFKGFYKNGRRNLNLHWPAFHFKKTFNDFVS